MNGTLAILGSLIDGDACPHFISHGRTPLGRRQLVGLTWDDLTRHVITLGATGTGKTVTQLRLAQLVMALSEASPGERPIRCLYLDAKGLDDNNRATFQQLAAGYGRTVHSWPQQGLDGFSGTPDQLRERLSGLWHASESPFHHAEAVAMLDLALHASPTPRTLTDLLQRVRPGMTAAVYEDEGTEQALRCQYEALGFTATQWQSLYLRLRALAATTRTSLDALPTHPTLESIDTAWISLPGIRSPQAAADMATWLLALLAELATDGSHGRTLVILDEFSAIGSDERASAASAGLVERTRSAGMGIVLGSQTTASLGLAGPRLLQTAGTVLAHRTAIPDDIVTLAGTVSAWEDSHSISDTGARRAESGRLQRQYRVDPDLVRALPPGEAVLISAGRWAHVAMSQPDSHSIAPC